MGTLFYGILSKNDFVLGNFILRNSVLDSRPFYIFSLKTDKNEIIILKWSIKTIFLSVIDKNFIRYHSLSYVFKSKIPHIRMVATFIILSHGLAWSCCQRPPECFTTALQWAPVGTAPGIKSLLTRLK